MSMRTLLARRSACLHRCHASLGLVCTARLLLRVLVMRLLSFELVLLLFEFLHEVLRLIDRFVTLRDLVLEDLILLRIQRIASLVSLLSLSIKVCFFRSCDLQSLQRLSKARFGFSQPGLSLLRAFHHCRWVIEVLLIDSLLYLGHELTELDRAGLRLSLLLSTWCRDLSLRLRLRLCLCLSVGLGLCLGLGLLSLLLLRLSLLHLLLIVFHAGHQLLRCLNQLVVCKSICLASLRIVVEYVPKPSHSIGIIDLLRLRELRKSRDLLRSDK